MPDKLFISVVVCAYNEENLLALCLQGLAKQTYPADRFEIIVVDDESTDSTFDIASAFVDQQPDTAAAVRLVRIQHGGLSVARNAGIELSRGEVVAFIDGDAVADPNWLVELAKPFEAGADYVGGQIALLNVDSWVARFLQLTRHRQFFGPRVYNDQFIGCNMAFRRAVLDAVGGFHENFDSRGDESTLRERIDPRFSYAAAPDAVVLHERPESISSAIRVGWKSATLSHLCAKAIDRRAGWKTRLMLIEQFLMALFPVLFCLVWVDPALFGVPLAISLLAVVRRLYLRPLNRAIAAGLLEAYGPTRGTLGHICFGFVYNMVGLFGTAVSPWLHRRAEIRMPMTTPLTVLKATEGGVVNGQSQRN